MGSWYKSREKLLFLALALPSLIGILVFYLIPFMESLYMAMIDNPFGRNFAGLFHFRATLENFAFRLALRNTMVFVALILPANMILSLGIAMLLRRAGGRKGLFILFILLPLTVPSGSVVHFWRSIFSITGVINGTFFPDNPVNWLNTNWAMGAVVIIFIWKNMGFNIVLFLAGINLIPHEYYEFAQVEGAGRFKQFRSITLVYLAPTGFMVFLMTFVQSFRAFREIYLLSGAYPHQSVYMLQHYMNNLFAMLDYQRISAASFIMTAGIVAIALVIFYLQRRVVTYE